MDWETLSLGSGRLSGSESLLTGAMEESSLAGVLGSESLGLGTMSASLMRGYGFWGC